MMAPGLSVSRTAPAGFGYADGGASPYPIAEVAMSAAEVYDLVISGSWAAGKLLEWTLASRGLRVAVIERRSLGGSCPNIACLPNKNVIHSAKVASFSRRIEESGISRVGWGIDIATVHDRRRRMIDGLMEMHHGKLQAGGTELHGRAGRELRKCWHATGLEDDQRVRGSPAHMSHESRIRRNHVAMQCIFEAIGTELTSKRVRRTSSVSNLALLRAAQRSEGRAGRAFRRSMTSSRQHRTGSGNRDSGGRRPGPRRLRASGGVNVGGVGRG